MTLHQRSRISSAINYSDYFTINGVIGCCCPGVSAGTTGIIKPIDSTFGACNFAQGYYFIPPAGITCENLTCIVPASLGCCCSCKYLTPEQRAAVDRDVIGTTFGMRDNITKCECDAVNGKWVEGPCNYNTPTAYCRKVNGVDVRLPKACCGVTLAEIPPQQPGDPILLGPLPYCQDVCDAKECSENTILNYAATFYNNGRRCFFANNAGSPVANLCQLTTGDDSGSETIPPTPPTVSTLPFCNNSNFICWGNNCENYVQLINNGSFINPSVSDFGYYIKSGAAAKLGDDNSLDSNKSVIGNGLFQPYTANYLYMKSRFGRVGLITEDNRVIFGGVPLQGYQTGIVYAPKDYATPPFYKYDRVEFGKNFAILRKQSNIGPRADFIGYLTPGNIIREEDLNISQTLSVHALEEAACVTRLDFLTNNVELFCKGYPFDQQNFTRVDGGLIGDNHFTIDPESVSCNGFHCTYQRYKLNLNREEIEKEWITIGEYKRTKDQFGLDITPSPGIKERYLPNPKQDFSEGTVVAGQNFDCFFEGVEFSPNSSDGYTRLSCYGIWDPQDTNESIYNINEHTFGNKAISPFNGGLFTDCDYEKCFAVMPTSDYCETNIIGNCLVQGTPCECIQTNRTTCGNLGGFFTNDISCADLLEDCEELDSDGDDGQQGSGGNSIPCQSTSLTERGACCRTRICFPNTQFEVTEYECRCRPKLLCQYLNGTFFKDKKVDEVPCGPNNISGTCCFRGQTDSPRRLTGPPICLSGLTNRQCFTCSKINENNQCISYNAEGGGAVTDYTVPVNTWKNTNTCPNCAC